MVSLCFRIIIHAIGLDDLRLFAGSVRGLYRLLIKRRGLCIGGIGALRFQESLDRRADGRCEEPKSAPFSFAVFVQARERGHAARRNADAHFDRIGEENINDPISVVVLVLPDAVLEVHSEGGRDAATAIVSTQECKKAEKAYIAPVENMAAAPSFLEALRCKCDIAIMGRIKMKVSIARLKDEVGTHRLMDLRYLGLA